MGFFINATQMLLSNNSLHFFFSTWSSDANMTADKNSVIGAHHVKEDIGRTTGCVGLRLSTDSRVVALVPPVIRKI